MIQQSPRTVFNAPAADAQTSLSGALCVIRLALFVDQEQFDGRIRFLRSLLGIVGIRTIDHKMDQMRNRNEQKKAWRWLRRVRGLCRALRRAEFTVLNVSSVPRAAKRERAALCAIRAHLGPEPLDFLPQRVEFPREERREREIG